MLAGRLILGVPLYVPILQLTDFRRKKHFKKKTANAATYLRYWSACCEASGTSKICVYGFLRQVQC
jgi:hypothetical protein